MCRKLKLVLLPHFTISFDHVEVQCNIISKQNESFLQASLLKDWPR